MRIVDAIDYHDPRDALSHEWIRFIETLGHSPILIPSVLEDPVAFFQSIECEGLILTNGENVKLESSAEGWTGSERDITEARLLTFCLERKIPVIGVCRGLQFINIFYGGSQRPAEQPHVNVEHTINIIDPEFREALQIEEAVTNSYHQIVVAPDDIATTLIPFAISDGVIEGLYSKSDRVLAVQWHPERQNRSPNIDRILFNNILSTDARSF